MEGESIRRHLRAALDEVISSEKLRLHKIYDESDADTTRRVKMMEPVIGALNSLKAEVSEFEGIDISPAPYGHMATVRLTSSALNQSFSISTNTGNSKFEIEEHRSYSFSSEGFDKRHGFISAEDVLKLVVDAVGKHIASIQVLSERKK